MDEQRALCNVWNTWLIHCNFSRLVEAAAFTQTPRSQVKIITRASLDEPIRFDEVEVPR